MLFPGWKLGGFVARVSIICTFLTDASVTLALIEKLIEEDGYRMNCNETGNPQEPPAWRCFFMISNFNSY